MRSFQNSPISRKLTLVIMSTSVVSLSLACAGFVAYELITFRQAMVGELSTMADIIGANSTASLAFQNQTDAEETLGALRSRPRIVSAAIYANEGKLFASYARVGLQKDFPANPGPDGWRFEGGRLRLFHPILLDGKRIGTLYLKTDLEAMYARFRLYAIIVAGVLVTSLLVAFGLSGRLQKRISGPILELTETARTVSDRQDYSVRAEKRTQDELGVLADAFNEMLAQIQGRDVSLQKSNEALMGEIAERKRAQQMLAQQAEELSRSNAELQQFAYVASHDLQEPLRAVAGCTQILRQRYQDRLDARADQLITHAVEGVTRMQTLINDLLEFSRVGTRGKPFKPTDCATLLKQVLANLEVALQESGAAVTHDPLPTVAADDTQLARVFQNLIGNAVKFRNERLPEIHLGAERKSGEWLFSVRDNGIGIDPQYFERIFVIFQRLHTRTEYPGTGMGLAICKKIVERHGGRIWVESETGKGTTFYFTISDKGGLHDHSH